MKKNSKVMNRAAATELYKKLTGAEGIKEDTLLVDAQSSVLSRSRINKGALTAKSTGKKLNFDLKFRGQPAAIALVIVFASMKVALSALEYMGFASVSTAEASMVNTNIAANITEKPRSNSEITQLTREEVQILTQLDKRRAELEDQRARLSSREKDLNVRERELTVKMNELKSLTERLKVAREQGDRKRDNQIEQLSKVYSAMAPEEAAKLLEQLDISIALSLVQKMPEKRIGQILALVSPDRALTLTKMLSGSTIEN